MRPLKPRRSASMRCPMTSLAPRSPSAGSHSGRAHPGRSPPPPRACADATRRAAMQRQGRGGWSRCGPQLARAGPSGEAAGRVATHHDYDRRTPRADGGTPRRTGTAARPCRRPRAPRPAPPSPSRPDTPTLEGGVDLGVRGDRPGCRVAGTAPPRPADHRCAPRTDSGRGRLDDLETGGGGSVTWAPSCQMVASQR